MKKKNLQHDIEKCTFDLFKLVEANCLNNLSNKCTYILSEVVNLEDGNILELQREQFQKKRQKKPKTLCEIIPELERLYGNLYDVNLHIFQAKQNETIIDIRYYPKSSIKGDCFKQKEPMLHFKVAIPPYREGNEKFDVNWELGGLKHNWKLFWWKRKLGEEAKNRAKWEQDFSAK